MTTGQGGAVVHAKDKAGEHQAPLSVWERHEGYRRVAERLGAADQEGAQPPSGASSPVDQEKPPR